MTDASELTTDGPSASRIAGPALEELVVGRLRAMLLDRQAVTSLLLLIDARRVEQALHSARKMAELLSASGTRPELVQRVDSQESALDERIEIAVDRAALSGMLEIACDDEDEQPPLVLTLQATRIRRHKDVRLIVAGDAGHSSTRNQPLVMLLAEARRAYDALLSRPDLTVSALSRETGTTRHKLASLIRVAMLAPDIVAHCLAGTQPVHLTTAKLLDAELPTSWTEQRRVLGMI